MKIHFYLIIALLASPLTCTAEGRERMHPEFILLDATGTNVLDSGKPISTMKTCGQCHDTEYIESHSDHAMAGWQPGMPQEKTLSQRPWETGQGHFGRWNPLLYRTFDDDSPGNPDAAAWMKSYGRRHVGGGPVRSLGIDMNCFLCHIDSVDHEGMMDEIRGDRFTWAVSASLGATGLIEPGPDGWVWQRAQFTTDGKWPVERVVLRGPTDENCGSCHGLVHHGEEPFRMPLEHSTESTMTRRTGTVFSGERICDSGISLAGKDDMLRPWDVHAERVMRCSHCHFSLNNPAFSVEIAATKPLHLRFDTRRQSFSEYLHRPSHQFASGRNSLDADPLADPVTMRRCEACHDAEPMHRWLPYPGLHFQKLSCEACHIPISPMAAMREIDWTVVDDQGEGLVHYRGLEGQWGDPHAHVTGFEPVFWPRLDEDGRWRLAPFNLVTSWIWVHGDSPRPVPINRLDAVYRADGSYRPDVIDRFDRNGDRVLTPAELTLDTEDKVGWVKARLEQQGLLNPRIEGEIQPYGIHHGVMRREFALCDCVSCHSADSRLYSAMDVSPHPPFGAEPVLRKTGGIAPSGRVVDVEGSGWILGMMRDGSDEVPLYVPGADRVRMVNQIGLGFIVAVAFGVTMHGGARYVAGRGKKKR